MSTPSASEHYSYRGIGFQRTAKGHWIFDSPPSSGNAWERYATNEEAAAFCDTATDPERALATMRKMVDRNLAGTVIYTGDLRFREALKRT